MRVAIYDLDKTITRRATFTPFLVFAARRSAPWRLVLLPVWIALMLAYRLGLQSRTELKRRGMRLMLGQPTPERLDGLGREFARHRIAHSALRPDCLDLIEQDRAAGARLVVATAAFEFYARHFAEHVGIDHLIATQWDGTAIPGGNCYGREKERRVAEWLAREVGDPDELHVRFVSDSFADAGLLDQADEAIFVAHSTRAAADARAREWTVLDTRY